MKYLLGLTAFICALGTSDLATAQAQSACNSAEHRALDFWVGQWTAYAPNGAVVGEDDIALDQVDCVVMEQWRGGDGSTGRSLSMYDRAARRWEQLWVDSTGEAVHFYGTLPAGGGVQFVSEGEISGASPAPAWLRMTITPNPDGSVRQLSEVSSDGQAWSPQLDLTYRRR